MGQIGRWSPVGQTVPMTDAGNRLEHLTAAPGSRRAEPFAGVDHPMRKVTRQVAFDGLWDQERASKISALFDSLAADWSQDHVDRTKAAPILDGLHRGGLPLAGRWLELGSGTGAGTRVLHGLVGGLVALDLSSEMLANAPGDLAPRVRGDASRLPFPDRTFDAVLMVNMLLFPAEVNRVLAAGGAILWVNTLGDQTPIHLPADDVVSALPGSWTGCTAAAGTGFWAALSRSSDDRGVSGPTA